MKIVFLGAGSTVFVKNVVGDCIFTPEIGEFEVALYDIDLKRLDESRRMLEHLNKKYNGKAFIQTYTNRKECLKGANFIVNAIQVGGYDPCTITDFEVPNKHGLRQTIGDTLGIGGIFRTLRTLPVLDSFAQDIMEVCPNALFLNYVNPMAILTGYMQRFTPVKTIGLCHSVQVCVPMLLDTLGMSEEYQNNCKYDIAGINHQAWLLSLTDMQGNDLYPEVKRRSLSGEYAKKMEWDLVRHDLMHRFGYYVTESSIHSAEYFPYYIKDKYPELLEQYKIPLDEYPRRCRLQIDEWNSLRDKLVEQGDVEHTKSVEYSSGIIKAVMTNTPYKINANVINNGLITNLPNNACVEVPCLVDATGIHPCQVGALPEQLAALNRTNINVQLLTIEAYRSKKKEDLYRAAFLDPHTSAELSLDAIKKLCDDLIEAHGDWLPQFS